MTPSLATSNYSMMGSAALSRHQAYLSFADHMMLYLPYTAIPSIPRQPF